MGKGSCDRKDVENGKCLSIAKQGRVFQESTGLSGHNVHLLQSLRGEYFSPDRLLFVILSDLTTMKNKRRKMQLV